jgi:DNA modification methylase
MNKDKIFIADSRLMPEVPGESVHLIITSPPYWQLKDYDSFQQIGFHDTYEEYITLSIKSGTNISLESYFPNRKQFSTESLPHQTHGK